MFLVMRGYEDSTIQENLFTRWFAAGLGVIILSLGEFEVYFYFFSIAIAATSLTLGVCTLYRIARGHENHNESRDSVHT